MTPHREAIDSQAYLDAILFRQHTIDDIML